MVPQNASQHGRPQQAGQQIALQSFGSPASSTMDISSFSLDSPEAAKQMAALNAASQARIAHNARIPPSFHPPSGGTSSGSYLGGINSHSYAAGNHDLLNGSANGHANFQIPNHQPLPQTPNSATSASFVDSSMSHPNALRNPQGPNQQRKLSFLTGLANAMAKRGTPLPPALTGVAVPNYDPNNSSFAFIEPSTEVGSFRLAGKDVDLLKLWATVFAHHGGQAVTQNQLWSSFLPTFDLPEHFPDVQPNGSTSVALMLSQYYSLLLLPFEEMYTKSLQEQAKKAQSAQRPGAMPGHQFPPQQGLGRPAPGMPNIQQAGMRQNNSNGLMSQSIPPTNGITQYPQMHPQNRPASSQNPHQASVQESRSSMGPSEIDPLALGINSNLLDQDVQGIKRKHDQEDREMKRVRQKTDPPESSSMMMSLSSDTTNSFQGRQASQPPSSLIAPVAPRQQQSRRKIEYIPLAREVQTYGGRDLQAIDSEWNTLASRRPVREIHDWGLIDIECLCMSIRSRLSVELSYALTTLTVLSTMRANTPGSGFPLHQCSDLLDDTLDLMEDMAFGEPECETVAGSPDSPSRIVTNRELVSVVQDAEFQPFGSVESRQAHKVTEPGPIQRPGDIVLIIVGIIRNMSMINDNMAFIANHPRLVDMLLRLCEVKGDPPKPVSKSLSLSDVLTIRKDTMNTLINLAPLINLSNNPSSTTQRTARRAFGLLASYLIDPNDSAPPLASVQVAGFPPNPHRRPPALADIALEVFTRFSHLDSNRLILGKVIPPSDLWQLLTSLVHRLPVTDGDFLFMRSETWTSYVEKIVMAIYSLIFLAPFDLKQKIKSDRGLGFNSVMLRFAKRVLSLSTDSRISYAYPARRAVEAMKLLDKAEDLVDTSAPTMPVLSFGMGFSDSNDSGMEKGTGILGGNRDTAWDMFFFRDVVQDEILFGELDSMVRIDRR